MLSYLDYFPSVADVKMKLDKATIKFDNKFVYVRACAGYRVELIDILNPQNTFVVDLSEKFDKFDFKAPYLRPYNKETSGAHLVYRSTERQYKLGLPENSIFSHLFCDSLVNRSDYRVRSTPAFSPEMLQVLGLARYSGYKENKDKLGLYWWYSPEIVYMTNPVGVVTVYHKSGLPIFWYNQYSGKVMMDNSITRLVNMTRRTPLKDDLEALEDEIRS